MRCRRTRKAAASAVSAPQGLQAADGSERHGTSPDAVCCRIAARGWKECELNQQTTLRAPVPLRASASIPGDAGRDLILHPADANHGIVFLRTGLPGGHDRLIDARHAGVTATELCTVIGDRACGRRRDHRAPDVGPLRPRRRQRPGRDRRAGNADHGRQRGPLRRRRSTMSASSRCGATRRYLKVLQPVRVEQGRAFAELRPVRPRLPPRCRDRFRHRRHRPPAQDRRSRARPPSAARSRAPAPSASCATSNSSGRRASRSAPRSTTLSRSATTAWSTPKACATPTSSSATRCSTRSAILRSPALRSSASFAPIAAATA